MTPSETACVVEQQCEHLPDGLSGIRLRAEQLGDAPALIAQRRSRADAGDDFREADDVLPYRPFGDRIRLESES